MNYIIFKADGSINEKKLAYYIQQGNTGVDTIFVSKADIEDEGSYTCQAFFKLPNGTTNTLAGVWTASVEYKTGVFANGWVITLTTNQTTYNGLLQMSISLLLSSSNLLTYPVALVINETGYQPDEDSGVTIEEINSYLVQLQSYQLKYDLANVRGYDTLALATADLPNLADGQIVIVKGDNATFYQVQSGSLVELISDKADKAYKDGDGLVIKSTYGVSVVLSYDSATDTIISKLYASDGTLLDTHSVALPKATTTKNGLMAKEDKVKVDALATTYETIVNSDAKVKVLGNYSTREAMLTAVNTDPKGSGLYLATNNYDSNTVKQLIYKGSANKVLIIGGVYGQRIVQYSYNSYNGIWSVETSFATELWTNTQLATKQSTSEKGQPNGYASLDSGGKVPIAQLPSYVDDVLEFANLASFPATGSASVIYVALDTNLTYRWSGSAYVEISPSLALGETAETAYRGDRGKTAYDHSQLTSGNPHNVTKADIGLDNVINPNAYNNIDISTDLDTITISGIYTCYGTANGVPSADYSWFVLHLNSGVGTTYAKQVAFAYDGKIYVRFKNTTWGAWSFIPASTLGFDNTIKNILTATNLQEAVDELTDAINKMISITYANLKTLRDSSQLVKGQQYRITDFVTTTAQTDTQSAGHAFDLIVVADDVNKLNENARACLHSGDTYFANSKLEAWKIKYCLDNDTTRFAWADETNGKGVIYQMIDEWNNDCAYDFKNIQFIRKITDGQLDLVDGVDTWVYTFTGFSYENNTLVDGTTLKASEYFSDEGSNLYKNNVIGIYEVRRFQEDGFDNILETLSDNVFIGRYNEVPDYEEGPAKIVSFSFNNNLGRDCYSNTFGSNCHSNTFGTGCYYNTFGDSCYYNAFGNDFYFNTFGSTCYSNTFGSTCSSNTFGTGCSSNTFGHYCYSNTFGTGCYYNTFGDSCYYNKLVSSGTYRNNAQYIIFENGVSYVDLRASDATGILQNIHISMGVVGASTQNMKVITEPRGLTHDVIYRATGNEDKVA